MSVGGEAGRILAFEREFQRTTTRRTEPFAWGTAYLDERFPLRWDSNLLWVEEPLHGVGVQALADEADRILGGAGIDHRTIIVDDEDAERLAFGLAELGYSRDRLVTMVHRHEPDRRSSEPVEEVDAETFVPIVEEATRPEPHATSEEVVRQLAAHRRVTAEAFGARFFLARADGRPASRCELYVADGVAQIENVGTLEAFRGRGLARAVVLRALSEAKAAGCDLVFLQADDADWPKELYAKLGFEPAGRWSNFDRAAPAG